VVVVVVVVMVVVVVVEDVVDFASMRMVEFEIRFRDESAFKIKELTLKRIIFLF
jgi:hypothetical protein